MNSLNQLGWVNRVTVRLVKAHINIEGNPDVKKNFNFFFSKVLNFGPIAVKFW